jgi:hypothetical protein
LSNPVPEELSPDASEVLQHEIVASRMAPVPVVVEGPVRVQRAPNKNGYIRSIGLVQNGAPQLILPADSRRARAQIVARGGVVRLASSVVDFEHTQYFELTNGAISVTLEHTGEVYAATIAADTSVHMIVEHWAD